MCMSSASGRTEMMKIHLMASCKRNGNTKIIGSPNVSANDRFSQTFDQTFDLSVFDLFVAWEVGACVYVMRPLELLAPDVFVRKHELTVWFSVPSVPTLMRKKNLLKPGRMPSLRWSLF